MQSNEFGREISREIKRFFGDRALDFVIRRVVLAPFLEVEMDFSLYGYFVARLNIERRTVFFSLREGDIGFGLVEAALLSDPDVASAERIGTETLQALDWNVRLRIPDKYLVAKGWL